MFNKGSNISAVTSAQSLVSMSSDASSMGVESQRIIDEAWEGYYQQFTDDEGKEQQQVMKKRIDALVRRCCHDDQSCYLFGGFFSFFVDAQSERSVTDMLEDCFYLLKIVLARGQYKAITFFEKQFNVLTDFICALSAYQYDANARSGYQFTNLQEKLQNTKTLLSELFQYDLADCLVLNFLWLKDEIDDLMHWWSEKLEERRVTLNYPLRSFD